MNVFSKPVAAEMSYNEYYNKSVDLSKYKIPQLKSIAKQHSIPVSGTKPILVERIREFFHKSKSANLMQRMFRGHMVRHSFRLRGPALSKRTKCVNDTDFVTLDPLQEIEYNDFYSYEDEKGFIYGFSIHSLMSLFKQKGKMMNPYNREKMEFKHMNEIFSLYKINQILFPKAVPEKPVEPPRPIPPPRNIPTIVIPVFSGDIVQNAILPRYFTTEQRELAEKMREIQAKPVNVRIRELFMEIDLLGNYTQESWFSNLSTRDYLRYHRYLQDIWRYRGQLSYETKQRICSIHDPFANASRFTDLVTIDEIRTICLTAIEYMVYTGIDTEYKKIGALHVLSALTIVSLPARQNMMWLYESLVY